MIKSKLAVAVVAALALGSVSAHAQDTQADPQSQSTQQTQGASQSADTKDAKKLEAVTVTGSLIPQTQIETATPVITITANQLKQQGFSTVAEALQQASFATGSVQGAATSASFTQGAQTLSMFGLPVGFVKYLIDGRPMGNFPALYNGSDAFNSLSGIPMDMVDHIDILPGGQSSLYGSDAIAGVINIVLKKRIDAPVVDVRVGGYSEGGGASRRISLADSFSWGKFNSLVGAQFEKSQPIWTYSRDLTKQFFTEGTSAPVASRDYLVNSGTGKGYLFEDPNNCANVTGQFGGTEGKQYRKNSGTYCGSFYTPGYATMKNDEKTANFYTHNTFDVSDNLQLYGDLLYNYSEQKYNVGSGYTWWGTSVDYGYIYDPNLKDYINLQRAFSPEDVGGYQNIMNKQYENSYMFTLGGRGTVGQNWDWDLGFTHSDDKLIEHNYQRFDGAIDAYFRSHVLGPQDGWDPKYGAYPQFDNINYAAFYTAMSPADFRSFTGYTDTYAKTWDNMLRGQVTNASLFSLPGGDAGVAVVLEGGNQGWNYTPDPRLLNGGIWGTTDVQGAGHRSRYAATTELKFPLLSQVTVDVSGRYDSYHVDGQDVSHGTYNIGIEYRPFDSLLLRGRYGTAFKVPTLADEFQGLSGYYSSVVDYANCARLGYTGENVSDCPTKYSDVQFFGQQAGSTKLKPITATVWSYGVVWAPVERMSLSVDYLHWDINNEVNQQSAGGLSLTEYQCDAGIIDMNTETCKAAFAQITRGASDVYNGVPVLGDIEEIFTPKVNVSNEQVNAISANFSYAHGIGSWGNLVWNASYSDELKHTYQDYPGDPAVDLLRHPGWSTDFKTKTNASLTWSKDNWSATLYANRYGSTPNYLATVYDNYIHAGTGKLPAWTVYNASITWHPLKRLGLSVLANNVFNKMPPMDHSYPGTSGSPYNSGNYNVYGRAMYLELNYKFGVAGE
ncbi:TonB-dependent receptor [Rhodanobacter sp. DHB23]|uniref:TonB-dependent receptor domain-containing protein n=1 Tax=Rhodanobacter sp. DHB23 TaxID=2775923 RepID=UPI0017845D66|nr:TonB-dependent receptor [Rhodanobacter sp. DHB23]MBD8874341.1 TonB-dependent receptor [Rhodanobacter sp. DHB23]